MSPVIAATPKRVRRHPLHPPLVVVGSAAAVLAGALLLGSAAAKGLTWAQAGHVEIGVWRLPAALAAAALAAEAAVGGLLLAAPWRLDSRILGGALFVLLAAVATLLSVSGADSCGCFGRVAVPPWATALVDGAMAAVLLSAPSPPGAGAPLRARLALLAALVTAAAVALTAGTTIPAALRPTRAVLLDSLPRACHSGRWIVCCYRSTCGHCRVAMPEWLLQARLATVTVRAPRWAFVAIDDRPPVSDPWPAEAPFPHAWRAAPDWNTPSFVLLEDGAVRVVSDAPPAVR